MCMGKNNINGMKLQKELYEGGFSRAYETMFNWEDRRDAELPFYKKIVKKYEVKSVLDVGCGNGFHVSLFKELSGIKRIVGTDNSNTMLRIARERLNERGLKGITLIRTDFLSTASVLKDKFDLILCVFGLSAIPSKKILVQSLIQFKKLLSKNGVLVIEDTNGDRIINHFPGTEHKLIEAAYYTLIEKKSFRVTVFNGFRLPQISKSKGFLTMNVWFQPLFQLLKKKSMYIKVYHNFNPYLINDHIFIRQGLIKRIDIESYRTRCWLLTKKNLGQYLTLAGFKKISFYSNHKFAPYNSHSYSQIVTAL